MNDLTVLGSRDILGKTVTVYGDFENPLVLAKDVAEWIEYSQDSRGMYNISQMLKPIDEDEKVLLEFSPSESQQCTHMGNLRTKRWFLTETGLYEVLFLSRKPIAKEFKKGVKKLLHDIRTGKVTVQPTHSLAEQVAIGLVAAQKIIDQQQEALDEISRIADFRLRRLETARPKTRYYDVMKVKNALCTFRHLANVLKANGVNIGQNRLFNKCRELGWIDKGGDAAPAFTQVALERKLGVNRSSGGYDNSHGERIMTFRAWFTHKGVCEILGRYHLMDSQKEAVLSDLTENPECDA